MKGGGEYKADLFHASDQQSLSQSFPTSFPQFRPKHYVTSIRTEKRNVPNMGGAGDMKTAAAISCRTVTSLQQLRHSGTSKGREVTMHTVL